MLDDHPMIFHALHARVIEIETFVDWEFPVTGAAKDHPFPGEIDAAAKDIVREHEHGIAVTVRVLADEFGAGFEDIVGVAPEDVIASGHIETLLTRRRKIVKMRP